MNHVFLQNSLQPPRFSSYPSTYLRRFFIKTLVLVGASALICGWASRATAQVTISPTSLSWNSVAIGNAGGQKVVTLTNAGSAITISSIGFTGTNAGDFSVFSKTCGSTLGASSSCTANIIFKPTSTGTRTATLNFTDSASNSPQQVSLTGLGTSSSVTALPSSLPFGSVNKGSTSAAQTVTVTNGTSSSVTLSAAGITGTNAADFGVSSTTCASSLAASAHCTASIDFKPATTGALTATWSITSSASSTPLTVALSGTGTSTGSSVTASPGSLSFGSINTGSTSAPQTVTVTNGTSSSVTLSTSGITGADASDFAVTSTTCGASLAASASCTASIDFKPATTGTLSATWSITSSASSTALTVALSGTGGTSSGGSAGTATPSTLSFGSYPVGATSSTKTATLKNTGSSSFSMSGISITGANPGDFFETTQKCGTGLSPSQSCGISLIFQPTNTGMRTATLTISDTASNSPQTVALSGTGTPAPTTTLSISPSGQSWGSQTLGTTAATKTFTLTAGGSGSLSFTSFGFAGTDPGDFSITGNTCGSTLSAGSSCTVTANFKPAAIGNRVALLSVTDSGVASPQTAEVSGTGAYSAAQTPSVTVDFGSRSGSQVAIPSNILGTEYLESLPTNANRTTVVQAGFTSARYRLQMQTIFPTNSTTPSWGALNSDMQKFVAAGVHPMAEVENSPTFLQPSPACNGSPETNAPTDDNEWGQLVAQVVAHLDQTFPGLVQDYEIWNEPNTTALCPNTVSTYLAIYAVAAPLMKTQNQQDIKVNANVTPIRVGGAATAGVGFTTLLTDPSTAPYVDFYSYHLYVGSSTTIKDGMTWDGAGGTPSLYSMTLNSTSGYQARFLQAYSAVKSAKTPLGAKTPIYFDEYNDDWAFVPECCRNSPTYSPLFNSMVIAQIFNSVYHGAATVPSRMIYFAAAQPTFCILGVLDAAMDCTKAATGAQAQPYPQWYTYGLMFAPSYLDLQDGGHMASSVTLSSSASSNGLIATAFYTAAADSVLIINPTASSYSGITLQINNPGLSSPTSTLYTINAVNPHVSAWPATTISASGGTQATFDLPAYSVLAISLK